MIFSLILQLLLAGTATSYADTSGSPIFIRIIKRTQPIFDQDTGVLDAMNPHPKTGSVNNPEVLHSQYGDSKQWAEKSTHADSNGLNNRMNQDMGVIEIWRKDANGTYQKESTFPICVYTGTLGPKAHQNDYQTPEGFYEIGCTNPDVALRNYKSTGYYGEGFIKGSGYGDGRAIYIGYPNAHDLQNRAPGANLGADVELHGAIDSGPNRGACTSKGCFGMTTKNEKQIINTVSQTLSQSGCAKIPVQIIPFPLTDTNLARIPATFQYKSFWAQQLKPAYDQFERTHIPPHVLSVQGRYQISTDITHSFVPMKATPITKLSPYKPQEFNIFDPNCALDKLKAPKLQCN